MNPLDDRRANYFDGPFDRSAAPVSAGVCLALAVALRILPQTSLHSLKFCVRAYCMLFGTVGAVSFLRNLASPPAQPRVAPLVGADRVDAGQGIPPNLMRG